MKILVIGSKGFIGSHLVRELEDSGHVVHGMDIKNGPEHDASDPVNTYNMIGTLKPDAAVHLAGNVMSFFDEDDIMETVRDHVGMTAVIAQACGDIGVRMVYGSSDEVYGDPGMKSAREDLVQLFHPTSAYGICKRFGEEIGALYAPGLFTALRFSMPYGPGAPAGLGGSALVNMLLFARYGKPIKAHIASERSWCWIGDAVRAARIAIERGSGPYNIGRSDEPVSMWTVAEIACVLTGTEQSLISTEYAPTMQTLVRRVSTEKIEKLGWQPKVGLYDGMKMTLEAWVNHLDEDGKMPVPHLKAAS